MLFVLSCTPSKFTSVGYSDMVSEYVNVYNKEQLDSVCKSEGIPSNLSQWLSLKIRDYETSRPICKYTYIYKDSLMFVVEQDSIQYTLNKRFIIK